MKNFKKTILLPLIIILVSCGYSPLMNSKNINFYITEIQFDGDRTINKIIRDNLRKHGVYIEGAEKYNLIISSNYVKNISNKDKNGDPKNYNLKINVKVIYKSSKEEFSKIYEKNISLAAQNKKIEEKELETKYKRNLSKNISDEIILYIMKK